MTSSQGGKKVPTYCYQCVAGPDLLTVRVVDGVATEVEPNFKAAEVAPSAGKVCVKAYGLIQKTYNPNRVLTPMKRTNPRKGRDQDPRFVPISWDEALDTIAAKLKRVHAEGSRDDSGYPRIAASFGGGGTPTYYMGTLPAFLASIGPIDFGFGSGQGVKCYHSEHLYGELWHRAFTVAPDTPQCDYILSFGYNVEASGGVCGVKRHADARARRGKRVQIEPHLSVTGACSSEWVPIRPKTDAAFMFALVHVLLHEQRQHLDIQFLKHKTNSPYLIAPHGYYLRHPESQKPLIWDLKSRSAVPFDTPNTDPAIEGEFELAGMEIGVDDEFWRHEGIKSMPAFQRLIDHMAPYSPLWAARICDVHQKIIRRLALEFLEHARIGETVVVEGRELPYRPVAVVLGKTVNNGWGGFDCCWARTVLACLVGALEVPGGILGTTVRLNRPAVDRNASVKPHPDGFMDYPMNPTDKENWLSRPDVRNANRTLIPLVANSPWSQALGPTHLAWMQQQQAPENWPKPTPPDVWFVYRTNPAISLWDTQQITEVMAKFPFTVCFAYTFDETNHMADLLLPDCTDLEGLQLIRVGGTKYIEQFWETQGFALRQPAVAAQGEARDMTWIATELAHRTGVLKQYNNAINRGAAGISLKRDAHDFSLDPERKHSVDEIWDAACRAASTEVTDGEECFGLDYFKQNGWLLSPFPRLKWYLYAALEDQGLRFELPYQERLTRTGRQLGRRLHEQGISWWDEQLEEYQPMPIWRDYPELWEKALERNFDVDIKDYPFWATTARSMQYLWGGNVGIQMIHEVAQNVKGHAGVIINTKRAAELGIRDGDRIEIRSPLHATYGMAVTRQGIRPDTVLMIGQFDHWATPLAKDFNMPSLNSLVPMLLDLTDSTGSGADLTRVQINKMGGGPMSRWTMVADLNRCVGCQTCTAACKHINATAPGVQWRKVLDLEVGEYPEVRRVFVPVGCQHCAEPPCMHVCPTTATGQRDDGVVTIDYDLCIGCGYCIVACPYQARFKVMHPTQAYQQNRMPQEWKQEQPERYGVAQKCTFCSDRIDYGLANDLTPGLDPEATPGCVNACIADALVFGDLENADSNVSQLLAENQYFRMHEELETEPGFYYLWDSNTPRDGKDPERGQ